MTLLLYMQIPNFVLAMPMLYISFAGCYEYFRQDWTRSLQLHLCPIYPSSSLGKKLQSQETTAQWHNHVMASKALCTKAPEGFISNDIAPYIQQWAVMTACALLIMNVQVATRYVTNSCVANAFRCVMSGTIVNWCDITLMRWSCDQHMSCRFLSACPALYWFVASYIRRKRWSWIWGYFLAYFCLGNILFTLFYPWT